MIQYENGLPVKVEFNSDDRYERSYDSERKNFYRNMSLIILHMKWFMEDNLTRHDGEPIPSEIKDDVVSSLYNLYTYYESLKQRGDRYDKGSTKDTKVYQPKRERESYWRSRYN